MKPKKRGGGGNEFLDSARPDKKDFRQYWYTVYIPNLSSLGLGVYVLYTYMHTSCKALQKFLL